MRACATARRRRRFDGCSRRAECVLPCGARGASAVGFMDAGRHRHRRRKQQNGGRATRSRWAAAAPAAALPL